MDYTRVYCSTCGPVAECNGHVECRCDGWQKFRDNRNPQRLPGDASLPCNLHTKEGFPLCRYCGKVIHCEYVVTGELRTTLVICPNCKTKFMGPRPYFPIDYECENCG